MRKAKGSKEPDYFRHIYDATEHLVGKHLMRKLDRNDFGENDLVLLEASVTKWKPAHETQDVIQFTLEGISLLCRGEADPQPAAPDVEGLII